MTRYCSWCGLCMGFKKPFDDPGISHGICFRCSRDVIEAAKQCSVTAIKTEPVVTEVARLPICDSFYGSLATPLPVN